MSFIGNCNPKVVGVDSTVTLREENKVTGFLAKTAGTITLVDSYGTTIVNAVSVTAGSWTWLPFYLGKSSTAPTFTTAGGASGTLAV